MADPRRHNFNVQPVLPDVAAPAVPAGPTILAPTGTPEPPDFFDPVPGSLTPKEPRAPLTTLKAPDEDTLNYLNMKIPQVIDYAQKADAARDIYTERQREIDMGHGPGMADIINAPDKSDPNYMAFVDAQKDWSVAFPENDSHDPVKTMRNVTNFLFSDEMGLLGMKWDEKGFDFGWENFQNQIVEHPITSSLTVASYMVPMTAAWMKGSRLAARSALLADAAGDAGAAAGRGFLGTNLGFRFDEHSRLTKALAGSAQATDGRQLFNSKLAQKILNATSPDEVKALMPEEDLRKILMNDWHTARNIEMEALAKSGTLDTMPGIKGVAHRAHYYLHKGFNNRYWKAQQNMAGDEIKSIDEFWQDQKFSDMLSALPVFGRETSEAVYKYRLGNMGRDDLKKLIGDNNLNSIDSLITREKELFKAQTEEGFLDDATVALFGEGMGGMDLGYHLPAIKTGTPGFEDVGLYAQSVAPSKAGKLIRDKRFDPAKALTGPTTKHRGVLTSKPNVLAALPSLEVGVKELAIGGHIKDSTLFQIHRGFRDMITSSLRGNPGTTHWIKSAQDYASMGSIGQKHFVSIDDLDSVAPGLSSRMTRMIRKDLDKTGQGNLLNGGMPVIDRDLVEKFFGREPGSAAWSANMAGMFAEMLTGVHKTAATALNPPTHMANTLGNFMFLAMGGMNPFSREALNDAGMYTSAFTKIARQHLADPTKSMDSLMDVNNLKNVLGSNRFVKDHSGSTLDLAELLSDPMMKEGLLEAQAFESVEGFQSLNRTLTHLGRIEKDGLSPKLVKAVGTAIAGIGALPGVKSTLSAASAAYLGEDMIPKMMYMTHLARKGWGRDAILMEVGRRLPQYNTVGHIPAASRRVVLPWITFTAETARIMKNNLADHPVSMMAWMQAPQIARAVASGAGVGADYSEYDSLMEAAPPWASRYTTVMLNEQPAPAVLGAFSGAAMGGVAGAAVGGFPGAAIGAAAGGVGGAALGATSGRSEKLRKDYQVTQNDFGEFARAWALDFLPYSSLVPGSLHPHEWEKINPFSDMPAPGMEALRTAVDLSPVEPFAIAKPLLDLSTGRGSFGAEIQAKSGIEMANKMALGLLGFISPPMMQKYGMNISTPDGFYRMWDIHGANGGQMTLPWQTTSTFGGLLGSSLTFLGAKYGLKAPTSVAAGAAAIGGTIGTMAGAEVNTRRLMTDLGVLPDPRTKDYNDPTLDFWINNWLGGGKSWKVTPNQALFNERLRDKRFTPYREALTRQWQDAIMNGSESTAMAVSSAIYSSFALQYGSPEKGQLKFAEWTEGMMRKMNKLPMFRDMPDDWISNQVKLMVEMGPEKSKIQRQQLQSLMTELRMHRFNKAKGIKIVEEE